jgi:ABC-type multidrug transport system fused ATPase/permease subunit
VLEQGVSQIRPIFRERGKINAEVTGRLTESLAGVRVVKGYHAEAEEASVFSAGAAAAGQRAEEPHRHFADEPFGHRADGPGGRDGDVSSARARSAPAR